MLRKELSEAQRSDPALAQIISFLNKGKEPKYIERRDYRRVDARARAYALAHDGVLVAKDPESDKPF